MNRAQAPAVFAAARTGAEVALDDCDDGGRQSAAARHADRFVGSYPLPFDWVEAVERFGK